jgi:heterodisulfide reductase subunit C
VASPLAILYLGWRALVVQPLKRLAQRGTALSRFAASYQAEGLLPTSEADRELQRLAARCTGCGLCEAGCDLRAWPPLAALGLPAAFRLAGRRAAQLTLELALLEACASCAGCDHRCPAGVPITRLVTALRDRAGAPRLAPVYPQDR